MLQNGFYIYNSPEVISANEHTHLAILDGTKITSMDTFYSICNEQFIFPDYFGKNTDAFYELMNDLEWLQKNEYIVWIQNYDAMFENDIEDKLITLETFYQIAMEWQNVPNYEGEEEYRTASSFRIYIDMISHVREHLHQIEIVEDVYMV